MSIQRIVDFLTQTTTTVTTHFLEKIVNRKEINWCVYNDVILTNANNVPDGH